jgi:MFS family permease
LNSDAIITRPFMMLVGGHLLQALGYASMLLLPLYLAHLGASRAEIGAAMAAASVGGLASRPLVGWGLDVLGRKTVLLVGTVLLATGMVLVGAITHMGALVYGMRITVGLGVGACFTGYFTLAADIIPAARRTEGLALFGISGLVPLLVNPFATRIGIEAPELRWFFPMLGGLVLASALFLPGVPEPRNIRNPQGVSMGSALAALRSRALIPVWTATLVFGGLVAVFMSFATVTGQTRGVSDPATVWLTYAAGAVSVRLFGARIPERFGTSRVGMLALFSYVVAFGVAAGATSTSGFAVAGLLAGIGHGYCFPVLSGQVVTRSPDALRGVAMASFTGLWEVARLLLAPAFGAFADATSDGAMLMGAAAFGALGLLSWAALEWTLGVRGPGTAAPSPGPAPGPHGSDVPRR